VRASFFDVTNNARRRRASPLNSTLILKEIQTLLFSVSLFILPFPAAWLVCVVL
jgi:hypothetical protein